MKTTLQALVALALLTVAAAPASASSHCTQVLSKQGAKAFFACLDRDRN